MNWIVVTVIAAFVQNLRFTLQKNINKKVSTIASSYVRFAFACPFTIALFFIYFQDISIITQALSNDKFIIYFISASISQIIFTFIMLYLFQFSNFIIGTSLSKTEVIQIVALELILFGDTLSFLATTGVIISTIGIIIFSVKNLNLFFKNLFSKTTIIGIITGFFLGLSVVLYRGATLSLTEFDSKFEKALCTLFFGVTFQTILMTIYIYLFEKGEFKKLYEHRYQCLTAGFCSFVGTLSWFYAFSLIQSSFVRALGQIELLFSYFSSTLFFKEKVKLIEIIGILIFVTGVTIMLVFK